MKESCAGNALQCTVHGSRWHTTAVQRVATVCEHAWLEGHEHVHDAAGRRHFRGDVDEPMAGLVTCVCTDFDPWVPAGYLK